MVRVWMYRNAHRLYEKPSWLIAVWTCTNNAQNPVSVLTVPVLKDPYLGLVIDWHSEERPPSVQRRRGQTQSLFFSAVDLCYFSVLCFTTTGPAFHGSIERLCCLIRIGRLPKSLSLSVGWANDDWWSTQNGEAQWILLQLRLRGRFAAKYSLLASLFQLAFI